MINILLYVSIILIVISYIIYFLKLIIVNNKIIDGNGFDLTKEMLFEYNAINVIESKNYFSVYNIKRKVIKLSTKSYYGCGVGDISLALIEAGISIVDDRKNKYIDIFRKTCNNLKILYILPIIMVFMNNITYNLNDAKVSIIFNILFSIVSYMLYDIKSNAYVLIKDNMIKIKDINNYNKDKILNYINGILWLDKLIFIGELIMILRCVFIILGIN